MRFHFRKIAKLLSLSCACVTVCFLLISRNERQNNGLYELQLNNYAPASLVETHDKTSNLSAFVTKKVNTRSVKSAKDSNRSAFYNVTNLKFLDNIFISVKSTGPNHVTRLGILLETWISVAKLQTHIFTDVDDDDLKQKHGSERVINTNCPSHHDRRSLVCKMSQEFDWFISSHKHWFCHVDDDTYVNVNRLVQFLQQYNHTDDWYFGQPSLGHPIEVEDRSHPGQKVAFWFATGGAGFCISRALALKMVPYAGGGRLQRAAEQIRLPDDCTIGYVIESLLHKQLTVIPAFNSHLEALWKFTLKDIKDQITLSYGFKQNRDNIVNIPGFPADKDPTRFRSIHCHLHPRSNVCLTGNS